MDTPNRTPRSEVQKNYRDRVRVGAPPLRKNRPRLTSAEAKPIIAALMRSADPRGDAAQRFPGDIPTCVVSTQLPLDTLARVRLLMKGLSGNESDKWDQVVNEWCDLKEQKGEPCQNSAGETSA